MKKQSSGKLTLALAGIAILVAVGWGSARMSRKMESEGSSASAVQFSKLSAGDTAKVVLELTRATSDTLDGVLLDPQSQTAYSRTATAVHVSFDSSTKVVMGTTSELQPGAVVHVTGTLAKDRAIQAQQLVIVTAYAKVK